MAKRRVAITGIGVLSGYGIGLQPLIDGIFSAKSCVKRIQRFDPSPFSSQIASEVPEFDATPYLSNPRDARRLEGTVIQAVVAAKLALQQSGLVITEELKPKIGVYVGSGIGGLITLQEEIYKGHEKGAHRLSPFFIVNALANMPAGVIAVETGVMGPNFAVVSACATSGHCLGEAMREIQDGRVVAMLAGGSERAIIDVGLGGFCSMHAVTADFNDEPERGSRPFDAKRSGFVMGEGAGIFVLEDWEFAQARGAKIIGEIVGYGASADAHHLTAPAPGGAGAQLAIHACLADAGLTPEQVSYVNAHGTSTPLNDAAETAALKSVFGAHAYKLLVSSTKSMHGHLLGAAASVESAACVYALLRGEAPPTINYENPDPECDLNYVPNKAQPFSGEYAMCDTFGFGGQNAVVMFKRV